MAELDPKLLGAWEKTQQDECAAAYAAHLRFQHNGLYFGRSEPAGAFTWWDGGTWRVTGPGQLALSTANDAIVTYAYRIDDQKLTFTDPSGCRFSYRRSA
ncbi:hypothetical protein HP532_14215 [Pseudomonas sp. CrR25]|nr:hypothetical protein [Pseudomonas sp. CrR25]